MTTQPPSHEEVQQLIPHLKNYQQCDEDGVMCQVSRQAVDEGAAMLEFLLADNVRLSTESRNMQTLAQGYKDERDQLRARIGELEAQIERVHNNYANMSLVSDTTKDERIAKALSHMQWCSSCAEGSWEDCYGGREALAALNPHASGTATGREG